MSFSRVKHGLGLLPRALSATSGYEERLNNVEWPIGLPSNTLKHDGGGFLDEESLQVVTITGRNTTDYLASISDFTQGSATPYTSFSSRFFKKNKTRMLYLNWWRLVASWRTSCSNTIYWKRRPLVRKHEQHSLSWRTMCVRIRTRYIGWERESERHTTVICIFKYKKW